MMRRQDGKPEKGLADLVRLLHGELSPAAERRLRSRLDDDPASRARLEALGHLWDLCERGLESSAPKEPEPDLWPRMKLRLRAERATPLRWGAAPLWVRTAAVAALLAGLGIGALTGSRAPEVGMGAEMELVTSTTAESYWWSLADDGGVEWPEERR